MIKLLNSLLILARITLLQFQVNIHETASVTARRSAMRVYFTGNPTREQRRRALDAWKDAGCFADRAEQLRAQISLLEKKL